MSTIEVGVLPCECTVESTENDGVRSRPRGLRRVTRWIAPLALLGLLSGCAASYVTPGGPVRLDDINRADIAEVASREPAADFPARLAVVRVQSADYRSQSAEPLATGRFSVVATRELVSDADLAAIGKWDDVAAVAPLGKLLLPAKLDSLDDLRVAAAKLQADVLFVYTVDTTFRVQGRGYGPLAVVSLGIIPDRDAYVTSTASALFVDVRTGFVYGVAEGTAKESGLTNVWSSTDTVDRKRIAAEQEAVRLLLTEARATWSRVVEQQAAEVVGER